IQKQNRPWQMRLVNLRDVLDPIDRVRQLTGVRGEEVYNLLLRRGLTIGSAAMLRLTHALIRTMHSQSVALLSRYWREPGPDLGVPLVPHFNRAIFQGLRAADSRCTRLKTPLVTIMTDLADYPPHFWIERQRQYFICGTKAAFQQALKAGH